MTKTIEIQFTEGTHIPKYRQIIDGISQLVRDGVLAKGNKVPSLNELCKKHNLSQDTVLMAYNELKSKGVITSSIGKGYYISNVLTDSNHIVFLLFDKLTAYKEDFYDLLKKILKGNGHYKEIVIGIRDFCKQASIEFAILNDATLIGSVFVTS